MKCIMCSLPRGEHGGKCPLCCNCWQCRFWVSQIVKDELEYQGYTTEQKEPKPNEVEARPRNLHKRPLPGSQGFVHGNDQVARLYVDARRKKAALDAKRQEG